MFDVGFSELVVIALVALIVIGPERLPKVARTVGILLGRLQRYVNDVKSDINREIQLDELKQLQEQVSSQTRDFESSLTQEMRSVEDSLNQTIAPPENLAPEVSTASPGEESLPAENAPATATTITEPLPAPAEAPAPGLHQTAEKAPA
ncbi:MAG: Sec-independent protein translocase protein TatB [Proteobacteria bacterium]|nr:Sec-independent protein translocase protein TatB [Pseudomonadota bacterium]